MTTQTHVLLRHGLLWCNAFVHGAAQLRGRFVVRVEHWCVAGVYGLCDVVNLDGLKHRQQGQIAVVCDVIVEWLATQASWYIICKEHTYDVLDVIDDGVELVCVAVECVHCAAPRTHIACQQLKQGRVVGFGQAVRLWGQGDVMWCVYVRM